MCLGDGDDVLDVGLPRAREIPARIGAVDPPAHGDDDARLDRLRIGIVLADIGRAAMFGRDGEATPAVADDLSRGAVPMQKDDACGDAGEEDGNGEASGGARQDCHGAISPIMAAFGGPAAQQEGGGGWGTGQILGLRPLWEIVLPERIRSLVRQDIQSGSDAEERIRSGSDRVPDFLIRWGQIDL